MGKASITIAIGAIWNGGTQIDSINTSLSRMSTNASKLSESTTQKLAISGESWKDLGDKIYNAGTNIASVGDSLTKKVTVPMSVLGGYCVGQATNFDTAIANLRKTSDLTADQLDALGDSAIEASKKQPVDAATIVNIEALGAQLGISDDKLQDFAQTVSGLDIATNMDADTAGTELARFANITGMADDAYQNYGSTIVAIGNNMATTESEVSDLAQRFASSGTAAGMSQAEILGVSGALSSLGVKAEMGGSAMSQVVNAISVAVTNGGDDLQAFADAAGMSADEFAQAWKTDAADALNTLVESMGKSVSEGGDVNQMLSDLGITGIRQSDVMRRLVDSTEAVTGKQSVLASALDLSRNAWEENTALQDEVDQRNESMQSRLDVLKNKVEAVAIEVGTPLTEALIDAMDALDPLFQGVSNAAQAFADMDEKDQRVILSLAGVAAGAGPVLSVVGRLTQGIGNINKVVGMAKQQIAVYGDALNTTDGSQMRVYSSSGDMASKLGTVKNKAAEAAGGAENYVSAWEGMTDSAKVVKDSTEKIDDLTIKMGTLGDGAIKSKDKINKQIAALEKQRDAAKKSYEDNAALVTQWSKSSSEAEKAADGIDELSDSLQKVKDGTVKAKTSVSDVAKSASTSTKSVSTFSTGMKLAGASALEMGKNLAIGTLKAGAIGLAIAGVSAAIGFVVEKFQTAKERSENLAGATDGLTAATNKSIKAAQDQSIEYENAAISLDTARDTVDKALESQANLADSFKESGSQASASMGQLQAAYNTIKEYANQSDLTAEEQGKLKAAVKTFNDECGTSIEVTDAVNGKLSENGEVIEDVTGKLGEYVQKQIEQIKLQEYSSRLSQLYQQKSEDIAALTTAQKAYNDELESYGSKDQYIQNYIDKYGALIPNVEQAAEDAWNGVVAQAAVNSGLNDAQAALDSCNTAINNTEAAMGAAAQTTDQLSDSISVLSQSNTAISSACDAMGIDLGQFSKSVEDTGISVDTFKSLNDSDWAQIVAAYEGSSTSIVQTMQQLGIDLGDSGDRATQMLVDGILSNRDGIGDAAGQLVTLAASGDWSGLAQAMEEHGFDIPEDLAQGLASNSGAPSEQANAMLSAVALTLTGGDCAAAAEMLGHDIDQGLADAIANNDDEALTNTYNLSQDVIDKAKETFDSHSPSRVFAQIGSDVDAGLAQGIDENSETPKTSAGTMAQGVIDGVKDLVTKLTDIGSESGAGMASGLGSWAGGVSASSFQLSTNALNGVSRTPGNLSSQGSAAGRLFAAGIGSYSGSTRSNAQSLMNSATSGTSGTPGKLGAYGSNASSRFANGIGSNAYAVTRQALILASNAQKAQNYGNPRAWGSHLASNFAAGIRAGIGWVSSAASAIARAAKNILKFSVPKEGPWSGSERGGVTSGMHLAQNFAAGMVKGIPSVKGAAMAVAGAAAIPAPAMGMSATPMAAGSAYGGDEGRTMTTVNNWTLTINGNQISEASPKAQELIQELFGEFGITANMGA